ncbi:MAG: nucleoside hydrolase [Thermomicrobia bacterium]|nr:nucleoside hydrolase [Thermomicrobia bacterium]
MSSAPLHVVLDCDTANEIDDQFAIAYALGSPTLDVRGVISVQNTLIHGSASVERYQEEAERVVALCGRKADVPCLRGGIRPMETRATPVPSEGLDFLIAEARKGPLTIIATGPITDVASLLLVAPDVREQLRVVWLGGFADAATYTRWRLGELNGRADIAAWRVLFAQPVALLQLPGWPGVAKLVVEYGPYVAELRALGRPVATWLAEISEAWQQERAALGYGPQTRKILWDVANVAAVIKPASVTVTPTATPALDVAGAHDFDHPGRTVDVVTDLDAAWILADLRAALLRLPAAM